MSLGRKCMVHHQWLKFKRCTECGHYGVPFILNEPCDTPRIHSPRGPHHDPQSPAIRSRRLARASGPSTRASRKCPRRTTYIAGTRGCLSPQSRIFMKTLDPPLDLNGVVAVWLESLLYGIYFCLFLQALRAVILGNKHRRHAAKIFLWASCVLFVVCTAHLVINLYRLMASALWGAPFYDTKHWAVISEITMNAVTTMIANCLMIYRCFIVWARSYKVIIVPSLLVVAVLALAGVVAQEYTTPPASAWVCVGGNMVYVLEFAQNAITTGLIAWNIWMHERSVETMLFAERASLNGVVRIIVESAAIYLVELFILIMLLAADHPAQYILVQAVVPTVGIVFTLLMLRLAARAAGPSETGTMHTVNFSPPMPMFSTSMDVEAAASHASSAPECRKGGGVTRVEYEEFEMDDCKAQLQIVEVATGCHAAPSKYHSSA